jgi:molybdopterin converting factor small subunit
MHMQVEVRLYATLRRFVASAPDGVIAFETPEGSTVSEVIAGLSVDPGEVHILMVNGKSSHPDKVLAEGDRLGLFPAVGGG